MKARPLITSAVLSLIVASIPYVAPAEGATRIDDRHISSAQRADIKATNAIFKRATNGDHSVLNYVKAKANDKGRVTARRKYAAGFEWRGGRITHISRAEHAKVRAYYDGKPSWASINGGPSPAGVKAQARNCHGRSELTGGINIATGRYDVTNWLDSCDVKAVMLWSKGVAGLAGMLAAAGFFDGHPDLAVHYAIIGAYIAAGREILGYYADVSDINAVWMRDHWHVITMGPQ